MLKAKERRAPTIWERWFYSEITCFLTWTEYLQSLIVTFIFCCKTKLIEDAALRGPAHRAMNVESPLQFSVLIIHNYNYFCLSEIFEK